MRFTRIALCAFVSFAVQTASFAVQTVVVREMEPYQVFGNAAISSILAQRTFAGVLPSIADYSQTAHSVLKDGEYCPTDSLTGASYCQPGSKWVMWDTPFMQFDQMDARGNYNGWEMDMTGFGTGIGRMLNDTTVVGLAVGWDARKTDMDTLASFLSQSVEGVGRGTQSKRLSGKDRSDAFHAALYGGTAIGCFFVDAYAGFSRTWHRGRADSGRYVAAHYEPPYDGGLGPVNDLLSAQTTKITGKHNDTVYSAGVKASYVWILPNEMRITPTLGLDYAHLTRGKARLKTNGRDYLETDGIAIIDRPIAEVVILKKTTSNLLQMPISVAVNKTFQSDFLAFKGKPSWWTPEFRAGYTPQFGSKRISSKMTDGFQIYEFKSSEIESYGTVGAGVKIKLADKYIFAVDYDYRFGRNYKSHLVTGTYGVSF